jgi:hypothetical protein
MQSYHLDEFNIRNYLHNDAVFKFLPNCSEFESTHLKLVTSFSKIYMSPIPKKKKQNFYPKLNVMDTHTQFDSAGWLEAYTFLTSKLTNKLLQASNRSAVYLPSILLHGSII